MTDTETSSAEVPRQNIGSVLERIPVPFFLFSLTLVAVLTVSYTIFLPLSLKVNVGGVPRSADQIRAFQVQLQAQLAEEEKVRNNAVLPFLEPQYEALKAAKRSASSLDTVRDDLLHEAASVTAETGAVTLGQFHLDAEKHELTVEGDVRNVGPRSMTVLAEFLSAVSHLSSVSSVEPPVFERLEDPKIGMHSPFTLVLKLP